MIRRGIYCIEGALGQVWVMMGNRVLLYINSSGVLHTPDNVIAFADIPLPDLSKCDTHTHITD
jgi:hypothetical protein